MIGPEYTSTVVQAILGSERSPLFPDTLWVGILDAAGELLATPTTPVHQTVWAPVVDGVTNGVPIDCGVAGSGWEIHAVGLFDGPDGDLILSAALDTPRTPAQGDPLVFQVGGLTFTVGGSA